jgi:glycosyltransferase involved in cell wall biosynthesis
MSRRAVLFVSWVGAYAGSTKSLATLMAATRGERRVVLASPRNGAFTRDVMERGIVDEHVDVPVVNPTSLRSIVRFAGILTKRVLRRAIDVNVIHANGFADLLLAAPAAVAGRLPVVVWVHDTDPSHWVQRLRPVLRILPSIRWVAVSPESRRMLVDCGLASESEISLVPNPIGAEVDAFRQRSDAVRVAFLGTDSTKKGFHLLPDLIEASTATDIRWLIFARDRSSKEQPVQAAWQRLRAMDGGRVAILGKQHDVKRCYEQADVVLCASLRESFCRVVPEAMRNGIPVIAPDLPAVRYAAGGDDAALFFPVGDAIAAARLIDALVADDAARSRLGEAGRRHAARFDPTIVAEAFLRLYDERPPGGWAK